MLKTHDTDLHRRQFLRGSSAAVAGALLVPPGRPGTAPRPARVGAAEADGGPLIPGGRPGATVSPRAYGVAPGVASWLWAAKKFDSYVRMPLATRTQKIYLREGHYFTGQLPPRITGLAHAGCHFIICANPSRTADDRAKLARCLRLLNRHGIVYQIALVNEWNGPGNFASAQDYLRYWGHYAPVVKAAGVPLCSVVLASSNKAQYDKIQSGLPVNPRPDRYWIDYYATGFLWKVRLEGLLGQASDLGIPAGIAEFGIGAHGVASIRVWDEFCHYLAGLAARLPLGCVYFGSVNHGRQDVVTGPDDAKVPGIRRVMNAVQAI